MDIGITKRKCFKVAYTTRARAKKAFRKIKNMKKYKITKIYRCQHCYGGIYHLTSQPK